MKTIATSFAQAELFGAQYPGDRSNIVYDGTSLIIPDDQEAEVSAFLASLPSDPEAASRRASLKSYASAKRFSVETGGIKVNGASIATDRNSQSMISGAYAYVTASNSTEVQFKATSGWVTLTAAEITAIALAVGAHVQACFATEKAVDDEIETGAITDTLGVDQYAWPTT